MEMQEKTMIINGYTIRYTLLIKKVKKITLKITERGQLIVTSNAYIPQSKVEHFIEEKFAWFMNKRDHVIEKHSRYYEDVMLDDTFYLFDQKLKIVRIQSNHNKVHHDDEILYVYYINEEDAHKTLLQYIKKICASELLAIVDLYFEKLKEYRLPYPSVKFRKMKSRWGSCIPSKNQITLNTNLLHCPKRFVEYVVLHELVHFIQPNHSASFYQVIQFHMYDYRERMQIMA